MEKKYSYCKVNNNEIFAKCITLKSIKNENYVNCKYIN